MDEGASGDDDEDKEDEEDEGASDDEDGLTDLDMEDRPSFEKVTLTEGMYVRTVEGGHEGQIIQVQKKKTADVAWLFSAKGWLKNKVEYPPAAKGKFLKSDQVNRMNLNQLARWDGSKYVCTDYTLIYTGRGYDVFNKDGTPWANLRKCGNCGKFGHNARSCEEKE
jgi:hypothetical protein